MLNNRSASTSRCPQMELIHKVIKKTEEEKKILETPLSANDLFLKQSYSIMGVLVELHQPDL